MRFRFSKLSTSSICVGKKDSIVNISLSFLSRDIAIHIEYTCSTY